MTRRIIISILAVSLLTLAGPGLAQTPAFPGAQGFGQFSTGGRGGTVYHVTNTNDSGTGSFRAGAGTANCTVVFDVGGVIRITSPVSVASNGWRTTLRAASFMK